MLKKVFTPGPTQVPVEVLNSVTSHITYHRSSEFKEFHLGLISKLKSVFQTNNNINVLTASGTGAMETSVLNFCKRGDKVIYVNQGRFGNRWGSICKAYGLETNELFIEPGFSVQPENFNSIDFNNVKAVFLTHSETSTATLTDLQKISSFLRTKTDALIIVDSISSIGAIEFKMDEWGVDVAVSASQKGLMTPPGLSIIAYSQKAVEIMLNNPMPRFYLDLRKEFKSRKEGFTSWTPAVGLMYGLDRACDIVLDFGLENWWSKTHECAQFTREEGKKIGFGLFSHVPTDSLTAFLMPEGVASGKLISALKSNYGIQVANGQAELKDKIFRVSHMGDLFIDDFKELMSIIRKEFNILKNSN